MSYEYLDPKRESDPYALADVEIFEDTIIKVDLPCCGEFEIYRDQECGTQVYCPSCGQLADTLSYCDTGKTGFWYAYGSPGYIWDSDGATGPFDTYEEALAEAREFAGIENL